MNRQIYFLVACLMFFVFLSIPFALALGDLMALQGNVKQNGAYLTSGNLTVYIFDSFSGGSLVYNSTSDFNNAISNGKYDVMLGNGTNDLHLEYGKKYYIEMFINQEKFSFNGMPRQMFQSSTGTITSNFIGNQVINSTHLAADVFGIFSINDSSANLSNLNVSARFSVANNLFVNSSSVGIGTSTSRAKLEISDTTENSKSLYINSSYSSASGTNYGVYSFVSGTGASTPVIYGGYFTATHLMGPIGPMAYGLFANATTSGINYGIYATASGGVNGNWAGYFDGQVNVSSSLFVAGVNVSNWMYNQTGNYGYNQTTFALTTLATNITALNASAYMWHYNQTVGALTVVATNITALNSSLLTYINRNITALNASLIYNYNQSNWNVSGNNLYPKDLADNIGIGTNSPSSTLDIHGNVNINSSSTLGSFYVYNTSGANHLFINGTNGFVGIGTSTPTQLFEVSGTGNITGSLFVSGINVTNWLYNQTGNYGYNQTSYALTTLATNITALNSSLLTYINGNITALNASAYMWHYNQTVGALTVVATNITALNASEYMWNYNMTTFALTTLATNITALNASEYMWNYNQTTAANLSIYNAYNKWWYNQTYTGGTYNSTYDSLNTTYNKWWYNMTVSSGDYNYNQSNWNVSGNNLYPKNLAYNVGIGTTTPSHLLTVAGNANVSGILLVGRSQIYTDSNGNMIFKLT